MKRGVVITIIVVFTVIIISVVAYLVYKSSKKRSSKEIAALQQQLANLQNQANSRSATPEEKQAILSQIEILNQKLKDYGVGGDLFGGQETTNPPVVNPAVTPTIQPTGFPLKKALGYNPLVENLQKGLNKKCNSGLTTDGKFGALTEKALYMCYNVNEANFELYNNIIS